MAYTMTKVQIENATLPELVDYPQHLHVLHAHVQYQAMAIHPLQGSGHPGL
jgi:hypothetical protein